METTLGIAYACFLGSLAWGLERLGRTVSRRADRFQAEGFQYREEIDAYECHGGEHLPLVEIDDDRKLRRYGREDLQCSGCVHQKNCTSAEQGGHVVRSNRRWLDTEIGKFHRGLSLVLMVLASLVLIGVALLFKHHWIDSVLIAIFIAFILCRTAAGFSALRRENAFVANEDEKEKTPSRGRIPTLTSRRTTIN